MADGANNPPLPPQGGDGLAAAGRQAAARRAAALRLVMSGGLPAPVTAAKAWLLAAPSEDERTSRAVTLLRHTAVPVIGDRVRRQTEREADAQRAAAPLSYAGSESVAATLNSREPVLVAFLRDVAFHGRQFAAAGTREALRVDRAVLAATSAVYKACRSRWYCQAFTAFLLFMMSFTTSATVLASFAALQPFGSLRARLEAGGTSESAMKRVPRFMMGRERRKLRRQSTRCGADDAACCSPQRRPSQLVDAASTVWTTRRGSWLAGRRARRARRA